MKRALIALLFCTTAHAQQADKVQHFGVSFVVGFAAGNQWPNNKPLAVGVAMLPGLAKELSDSQKGGTGFSGGDMAANLLGAVTGVYTANWLVSRSGGNTVVAYRTAF